MKIKYENINSRIMKNNLNNNNLCNKRNNYY